MPAPREVKWAILHRYGIPTATWIETGTFLGDTTAFLAQTARWVYSIEPEPRLAESARKRFSNSSNVTIIEGLSEDVLEELVVSTNGPLALWLDGHFSAGITHRGPQDTPIRDELAIIEKNLGRFTSLTVLVDDVRCFAPHDPNYANYPSLIWLVQWADRNCLEWTIEQDIFIARRIEKESHS